MRSVIVAYISGLVVMVALDFCWLTLAARTLYKPGIGDLMADKPALLPAALFYLLFIAGMTYLVTLPALPNGLGFAASRGAVLGLTAYATYDLTAQAVLRNWPVSITVIDIVWGTVLTTIAATAATFLAGKFG